MYNGSKLMQMTVGGYKLTFTYDGNGAPSTVTLNGVTYYYVTNLQGDVIEIWSASGTAVCYYCYDAWGNTIYTYSNGGPIASLNPLRYRGYVYDRDTGFYYLQSRYYDPAIGRFINADIYISTGQGLLGYNMFAYCYNRPVCMADYNGEDAIYVVTTGEDGLPIVGHAILFVQDAAGNWYKTHFTGATKRDARVYTYAISEQQMQQYLSSDGVNHIYITGDFSASYELAQQYKGSNYGGYNLFANNCLHYTRELLSAGSPDNTVYNYWFDGSQISPMMFYKSLLSCSTQCNSPTGGSIHGAIHIKQSRSENYVY